jgi:hypothetical protein
VFFSLHWNSHVCTFPGLLYDSLPPEADLSGPATSGDAGTWPSVTHLGTSFPADRSLLSISFRSDGEGLYPQRGILLKPK